MTDCVNIIDTFLKNFDIFLDSKYIQNFENLLELIKSEYFNGNYLQKIFPTDLIKASQLFEEKDRNFIVCKYYQKDFILSESLKINMDYFNKFSTLLKHFISFRNYHPKLYLQDLNYLRKELEEKCKFLGWEIGDKYSKDIDYIISKGAENEFMKGIRFVTNKNLEDILFPQSLYQVIYKPEEMKKSKEYIGFDLDGTLIKSNNSLIKGVKEKLKGLFESGYNIIVVSNQKRRKIGDPKLKIKIEKVLKEIDVPMIVFCAREENVYRKPDIGCTYLVPKSFGKMKEFVGDAAGRIGDHSDDDLQFAKNFGVEFKTAESYFR